MIKKTQKELRKDQDRHELLTMVPELICKILNGPEEELIEGTLATQKEYDPVIFYVHFEEKHGAQIRKLCEDLYDLSPDIVDYEFSTLHSVQITIAL